MNVRVKARNNEILSKNVRPTKQILFICLTADSPTPRTETTAQSTLIRYLLSKGIEVHLQWAWTGGHRFEIYFGDKGNGISGPIYRDRKGEDTVKVNSGISRLNEQAYQMCHYLRCNAQRCVPDTFIITKDSNNREASSSLSSLY